MEFTFFGHACFMVKFNSSNLLFDPFITPNPSADHIDINNINPDYILISHGHEDHVADVEHIAKQSGAKLISNFEIISYFENKGLDNTHPMNHGGQWNFDFGTVKYVNAIHSSGLPDGSYGGNPGGFIIKNDKHCFYYAGDTALHADMKIFGEQENFDFVILPIGDNFTMGIEDAIIAAKYLKCKKVIGIHFNTFPYIEIDNQKAVNKFKNNDLDLILLNIGESINLTA